MLELINPEDLPKPQSYHQVAVATGSRWVFVSGQVSEDVDGNLVGAGAFMLEDRTGSGQVAEDVDGNLVGVGDFALQARTAFANVDRALAAAGARPGQVARIPIYV